MNSKWPWGKNLFLRILFQLSFVIVLAVIVSTLITLIAHAINAYQQNIYGVLFYNALIYAVVNLVLMAILEAWIYYKESTHAQMHARNLELEVSQMKFEILKSQINPHFLFNSLNVLSGLINKSPSKAIQFIDEFSQIYRYVLETIEQKVSRLEKELEFARSYLFLQQIRYGQSLTYNIQLPAEFMAWLIPPLSLQVILENAIKHNIVNKEKPLHIELSVTNNCLYIKNNLQPKIYSSPSTGTGLENLLKRYAFIHTEKPVFTIKNNCYIAKLPLITPET